MANENYEVATLGGGCFWCVETVFNQTKGVISAISGYMGGATPKPSYEEVCTGRSGHVEVVQVTFDPAELAYREVLEIFFTTHDPTTLNRQGNDIGTQYRSVIFYHSAEQEDVAVGTIRALTGEKVFSDPIVTAVEPAQEFYPAEKYHQNYFANNPNQPYCAYLIAPKVQKFRAKYAARLK